MPDHVQQAGRRKQTLEGSPPPQPRQPDSRPGSRDSRALRALGNRDLAAEFGERLPQRCRIDPEHLEGLPVSLASRTEFGGGDRIDALRHRDRFVKSARHRQGSPADAVGTFGEDDFFRRLGDLILQACFVGRRHPGRVGGERGFDGQLRMDRLPGRGGQRSPATIEQQHGLQQVASVAPLGRGDRIIEAAEHRQHDHRHFLPPRGSPADRTARQQIRFVDGPAETLEQQRPSDRQRSRFGTLVEQLENEVERIAPPRGIEDSRDSRCATTSPS